MKILIACEFSGIVRESFRRRGHDAYSCDLIDTEIPGKHIKDDVRNILSDKWDAMIAFPPCTRLANSGVRWLSERNLWDEMKEAALFFKLLLNADIPRIVIENPIPHKYALEIIGRKYDQIIQPYNFGHGETKRTCLWLKNFPRLMPTHLKNGDLFAKPEPKERLARIHLMSPSPDRAKERSRTYSGIAETMAMQWGAN